MAAPVAVKSERLGDLLVSEGLITQEQLARAMQELQQQGTSIGYNLIKLGFVKETDLTRLLARRYRMPAVDLKNFEVDLKIARLVPPEITIKHQLLALKRDGRTLTVAVTDPSQLGVLDDLKFITGYEIFPVVGGEFTLRGILEKHFESTDAQMESLLQDIDLGDDDIELLEEQEED